MNIGEEKKNFQTPRYAFEIQGVLFRVSPTVGPDKARIEYRLPASRTWKLLKMEPKERQILFQLVVAASNGSGGVDFAGIPNITEYASRIRKAIAKALPKSADTKRLITFEPPEISDTSATAAQIYKFEPPVKSHPAVDVWPIVQEVFDRKKLISTPDGGFAQAIKLLGSGSACWSKDEVVVEYDHIPFQIDEGAREAAEQYVQQVRAKDRNAFNGPAARLLHFSNEIVDVNREIRHVKLRLGPVDWFQYLGLNARYRDEKVQEHNAQLPKLIGLDSLLASKIDSSLRFVTSILGTASTMVSRDGFLFFSIRPASGVERPATATSSIAENISRYLDDGFKENPSRRINKLVPPKELPPEAEGYVPKGTPNPFATVQRGIQEEISACIVPESIKMTGICYDLESLHPDLLFLVPVNLTAREIEASFEGLRGVDDFEIDGLKKVKWTFRNDQTLISIHHLPWISSGKASLIRALQICEALSSECKGDSDKIFGHLLGS